MIVKRILIYVPVALVLLLAQSFFWVPTYDNQAVGNPERLVRYIQSSTGDAQMLNPILHADTASGAIVDRVFDGLIDLDDRLNYRPRLAAGWKQYEIAYLSIRPGLRWRGRVIAGAAEWIEALRESPLAGSPWFAAIRSMEAVPAEETASGVQVPETGAGGKPVLENGRPQTRKVRYTLRRPERVKFVLTGVDQDFFKPIEKHLGQDYFTGFPYETYIRAKRQEEQALLRSHYPEILPVEEHNPVIEFELRKGVRFHDGHPFDSGDVLFTYRSIMDPRNASPRMSDYEPVKSADVLGPYRIRFVYKRLFSPAINSWFIGILPEHLLNRESMHEEANVLGLSGEAREKFSIRNSRFNRQPVGTGPFIFKEWQADELIRLTRNPDYWEAPPEYKEFVMRIIPDPLTQEMEFYSGAVDNYAVQPHQAARFKKDKKFQSFSSLGYFYSYIGYNLRKPLFSSPEVRRALGMAIDVNQIIDYILYGEGERVTGPYPKITDWYDPSVEPLPYDPQGALEILNRLGWKKNAGGYLEKDGKPFEFNLITNSGNPIRKNILTIAQNSWNKLGIKCNTQMFEWAVFLKDFVNVAKFDALVLGWSMGIDPDLYQIWHSSQTGPQQLNFVGYQNPRADRLILRIRREYDKARQAELAHRLHRIIARDQPYTFLYVAKTTLVLDKKIVIVDRQPDGTETYRKIYPTRDGRVRYYFNKWRKLPAVPAFAG